MSTWADQLVNNVQPTWLIALGVLALGVVLLVWGGSWLVDGSVAIAKRFGVSTLLIGLTIVAFGTSTPELALNIIAALAGSAELSFGNVVGSNIANIGLVLGLTAVITPMAVHSRVVQHELPLLIGVSLIMLGFAIASPWFMEPLADNTNRGYNRIAGLAFLIVFACLTWQWYLTGRREQSDPLTSEAREITEGEPSHSLPIAIIMFVAGIVLLIIGGQATTAGAVKIAAIAGVSEALVGLTIVAVATSLPEAVTTLTACRKGHSDLAVGNVVGSNLFNILLVLGVTSFITPVPVPVWGMWDLGVMCALTCVLMPLVKSRASIERHEGGMLLFVYVGYLTFSVIREL